MSEATLITTGAKPVLRFERFLPRPVEEVWRAVTDPIELRGFELSPVAGGTTFLLTEELGATKAARNAAGWEVCLERLVAGSVGEGWVSRFERYIRARAGPGGSGAAPRHQPRLSRTRREVSMPTQSSSCTTAFTVDRPAKAVFDAINDVRGWWSEDVVGRTDEVGAEFFHRYQDRPPLHAPGD